MRKPVAAALFFLCDAIAQAQPPVVSNKHFSFGTYGRAGVAFGLGLLGNYARPPFSQLYSVAKYHKFAAENSYSPFIACDSGRFGHYLGVKAGWWLW